MKGMRVYIYKTKDFESCSNEGLSSKYNQATLVGPGVPEIFKPDDHAPAIKLDQSIADHPRAWPIDYNEQRKSPWYMFGGAFIYSTDSRFPSTQPIKLMDRREF